MTLMEVPLISVAITTYNGEKFLEKQLCSILAQTHANVEIVICDDGSSDNTIKIIQELQRQHKKISLYQNDCNLGYVKNFEKAIELCAGEYIALSDQDDIWLNEKLEKLVNNIGSNLLIHSDVSLIDDRDALLCERWKGNVTSHTCFEDFMFSNVVTGCTVLFRKEILEEALPFPKGLAYHDWWLGLVAAKHGRIIFLNEPLILYRQHESQDTGAFSVGGTRRILNYINGLYMRLVYRQETRRMYSDKVKVKNLRAVRQHDAFPEKSKVVDDVIEYFDDVIHNFIHIKTFLIGLKYCKHSYGHMNPSCIKNILKDLIG